MIDDLHSNCNDNQQESRTNRDETHEFLSILDPDADFFTFQTFDDNQGNGKAATNLAHILHGTLAEHVGELRRLNRAGAGVFVMVNAGDGEGRRADNVRERSSTRSVLARGSVLSLMRCATRSGANDIW